ncbi:MAG: hypothetical protein M3Q74_02105 [Pseudomonadota bacterium]|nr:hypothetical protein [Pseudomonadota bacterium]
MNSAEKHRILAAYERAGLVAALASRGFYVIGEVWRDRACGWPPRPDEAAEPQPFWDEDQPRPAARDHDPEAEGAGTVT